MIIQDKENKTIRSKIKNFLLKKFISYDHGVDTLIVGAQTKNGVIYTPENMLSLMEAMKTHDSLSLSYDIETKTWRIKININSENKDSVINK